MLPQILVTCFEVIRVKITKKSIDLILLSMFDKLINYMYRISSCGTTVLAKGENFVLRN